MLEQASKITAQRVGVLGVSKRVLQLAEDLWFAEHHRVQSAGDPEDMSNRFFIVEHEQRLGKIVTEAAVVVQPLLEPFPARILADHVKFSAITGR